MMPAQIIHIKKRLKMEERSKFARFLQLQIFMANLTLEYQKTNLEKGTQNLIILFESEGKKKKILWEGLPKRIKIANIDFGLKITYPVPNIETSIPVWDPNIKGSITIQYTHNRKLETMKVLAGDVFPYKNEIEIIRWDKLEMYLEEKRSERE
ncbi:MAG: hypothetical protein JXQ74_03535 [Alphaproteobacteria bacterium]|nr:hypothetical protein [Alphaproteobacteria bacterium]